MVRYPDDLSLLEARNLFFRDAKLGPSASATDVGLFLFWCIPSVLAWLPLPFLTVILFWLIMGAKFQIK